MELGSAAASWDSLGSSKIPWNLLGSPGPWDLLGPTGALSGRGGLASVPRAIGKRLPLGAVPGLLLPSAFGAITLPLFGLCTA